LTGNVIFAGLPGVTLAPLRRVMNVAVRFVAGLGPRDHVTAAYKLCILMHAVRNGTAPTYTRDLVTVVNEISGRSHLRSATLRHFDVPRTRTKLGSRAFSVAGPVAWNSLPASIRELTSTNSFKRQLKTHLFRVAYEPAV